MLKNIVSIVVFMLLLSQVATVNAGFVPGFELGDGSGDNHAVSGSSFTDPTTGMEFVLVKGGCYQMGDTFGDGQSNEKPVHKVCVDDFYMGKYEVTQKQYQKIVGSNPSSFKGSNRPVEEVSWNDAQGFIRKLNSRSGKSYRLPTEAEWEYAARSGGKNETYSGFSAESELSKYANYCDKNCQFDWKDKSQDDGYSATAPVGSYRPNGLGLYDMSGNVWEWCSDRYDSDYYQQSPRNNPQGPSKGSYRVFRGGSWDFLARIARAANRYWIRPDNRNNYLGFRLVFPTVQ